MGGLTRLLKKIIKRFYVRVYLFFVLKTLRIKVRIATTPSQLNDAFSLRYEIYLDSGYIDPKDFPDQLFEDKYDKHSINFIAYRKKEPIGIVRLVLPSEAGFPIEEYYNVMLPFKDDAVEVSRLAVDRDYRGDKRRAVIALMRAAYYWSRKNNVSYWYMFMPEKLARSFEDLAAKFYDLAQKPLGEEQAEARRSLKGYFKKTKAKPYMLNVEELTQEMHRLKIYW
ncbi:MAG: GNAT family N-acyltransferase [Candidatus Spechtbacterales bacterium]|nr:GNAT family N-acyltransferase [Candidatus Spechtbacterales bacterium]